MNGIISEVSEAFYAALARGVITVIWAFPGVKKWWEESEWTQILTFGICVTVALSAWAIVCPLGWAEIPGYDPRCDAEGVILDVMYAAFLAWLINWAGENAFKWARERRGSTAAGISLVQLFLGVLILEAILLSLGLPWQTGLVISVLAAFAAAILGAMLPSMATLRMSPGLRRIVWWLGMGVKIIIHFLPITWWLKPILSVALTAILFIIVNFV